MRKAGVVTNKSRCCTGSQPDLGVRSKNCQNRLVVVCGLSRLSQHLAGMLLDMTLGLSTGALPFMTRAGELNMSPSMEGLVASSLTLGAAFGAVLTGRVSIGVGGARSLPDLLSCRRFDHRLSIITDRTNLGVRSLRLGLSGGRCLGYMPTFLAEIAPSNLRGRIVTKRVHDCFWAVVGISV